MALSVSADRHDPSPLTRDQVGWLGEQAVDRAFLVGSGGRLQPYVPVFDTRGVDRAYSWDGIGPPHFVQIKACSRREPHGTYVWTIHESSFRAYRRFSVVCCTIDPLTGLAGKAGWRIPSVAIRRVATRGYDPSRHGYDLKLRARPVGTDGMAGYRRGLQHLWSELVKPAPVLRPPAVVAALTSMRIERGTIFELGVVLEGLRGSHDDLLFFRPAMDMVGRDLLVQLVHTSRALYLQIKGRFKPDYGSISTTVPLDSFAPSDDFWLAFFYYDQHRRALFEDCWLVPSVDFARMTADQRDPVERTFSATLDPAHDRWREFRHPVGAQAAVLRRALKTLAR